MTAVPAVVWSDSELDSVAASWSTWVCACTRVWSRSFRSAAICPELIALVATMSIVAPFGSWIVSEPTPDLVGLRVVQRVGDQRSRRTERHLEARLRADQLNAGIGEDVDLVGGVGDGADVHQLRQLC